MAQVGYTPISLYYSSTPAATPLAANLTDGELALNTADGKLFYKNSSGVVQLLASTATAAQTFSAGTTGLTPSSPTTGTITLGGTLVTANGGTGFSSYAIGDILFANTTTALAKLPIGLPEMVLVTHPTNGKPAWTDGLVLTSLDVFGGFTRLDYLEVYVAASFLGPVAANSSYGTPGQVLTSNGSSNPAYWSTPSTTAAQVANSVTFNNSGSGAASGTTFNGSAAQTISYNTIGAPSTTGTNATGTWAINVTGSAGSATNATNASNLVTTNWTVLESGGFLYFRYGGVNKARLDSSGNFVVTGNVTAFGSI